MPKKHLSKLTKTNFSLKLNILANFFGNAVMTAASIVFVPIYLRYIGIEAYGLVGFFVSFQAVLLVMDFGLSLTLTRELALRDGIAEKAQESRNLLRTLEIIYWGIALSVGLLWVLCVPFLTGWVNPNQLSIETVRTCFLIMSLMMVLQFPTYFYQSGLFGLQKQVLVSVITIFSSLIRYVGALAVLHFVSNTPQTFFIWQVISSALQISALVGCLWMMMPKGTEPTKFQKSLIGDIWKIAGGMGAISVLLLLIMQIDKVILVKILPLEAFGYYALAGVVATALYRLIFPVFQAYLPRLTQLAEKNEDETLTRIYHQGCQVMAVVILPLSAMLIFFPQEIVFLWQQNAQTTENIALLVSLLTVGYAANSLIYIPYALQLAFGRTKFYLYILIVTFIISIPLTVFLSLYFGTTGAAIAVILVYTVPIFILIPLMHRRLLPDQMWKWIWEDVGLPLVPALAVGFLARFLFINQTSQIVVSIQLSVIFGLIFLVTCLITPYPRNWIINNFLQKNLSR
jgi:O-antigen/teichoic acid export membrane protein